MSRAGHHGIDPEHEINAVEVLDHLVNRAVTMGASDIHIEPKRKGVNIRFRIDGVMCEQGALPAEIGPSLATRIKVLSRIDMTIRRLPQDGQCSLELEDDRLVHLRVSTFPAIHGETIVLRLLLGHSLIPLDKLGMDDNVRTEVENLTSLSSGLILVCGPTGSGKTSTLYSMLQQLDTDNLNVVTLEDPIEVEFDRVTQGQTNERGGLTFAAGLRAILRQDPDVIMVGEMRDAETAQIALQASLTGHLVMSTLHTSNTVETIARVIDLGAEPWIVANSLQAIIAQRLVRRLCHKCSEVMSAPADFTAGDHDPRVIIKKGQAIRGAAGCEVCHDTGYIGRMGIFEVLTLDDTLRDLVKERASTRAYREHLNSCGGGTLREVGLQRVLSGHTTLAEVLRVT